ncbi:MAG: hypothetical protein ACLVIY_09465 [Anaerobutyricum soehngenii]
MALGNVQELHGMYADEASGDGLGFVGGYGDMTFNDRRNVHSQKVAGGSVIWDELKEGSSNRTILRQ